MLKQSDAAIRCPLALLGVRESALSMPATAALTLADSKPADFAGLQDRTGRQIRILSAEFSAARATNPEA